MNWTEIKITVDSEHIDKAGDIANMVVPYGIYIEDYRNLEQDALEIAHIDMIDEALLSKDKTKGIIHIYFPAEESPKEALSFLEERFKAESLSYSIDELICKNEDWEQNWKAYFKPIPIGEKLLIRPVWEEVKDNEGRVVINLEPGVAFGTGTHETTRLCLEALETYDYSTSRQVLDIGCGSGILSVATLLLGAQKAVGVDIDELAVKTALENGRINGFSPPQYSVICGSLTKKVAGRYDIVVANIVADAIIELSESVKDFMKPGALYIVSGIIDLRETEVREALEKSGFTIAKRREQNGWLCFECTDSNN